MNLASEKSIATSTVIQNIFMYNLHKNRQSFLTKCSQSIPQLFPISPWAKSPNATRGVPEALRASDDNRKIPHCFQSKK